MSVIDNRTQLQDCEASADFATTGAQLGQTNEAGLVFEGTNSIDVQHSNVFDDTYADQDSGGSAFNIDLSNATVYLVIKDNVVNSFANLGATVVVGDGTNRMGYSAGGNDAVGIPLALQFWGLKLDVSEPVAVPGTVDVDFHEYAGTEASLDQTQVTNLGVGTLNLAKAAGTTSNLWIDGIYYIANGTYAMTINGGTAGTPEEMSDIVGDDVAAGMGMISSPLGKQYIFFATTEWGEAIANAEHAFIADNEQWIWMGNISGGRSIGAGNFDFRLVANSTDTASWIINGIVIVNIGARVNFLMDDADFDTIEQDGCSITGLGTIALPSSGGSSRFTTNSTYSDCDQITNNGADMDGCSILGSIVSADVGALLYNEASDPDGTLDNLIISKGANAHHAIDFGANVDSSLVSITLTGIAFNGFGASDDSNDSTVRFLATTGTLELNLIDCTVDGISPVASGGGQNFSVDDAAGITVAVVVQAVVVDVIVKDKDDLSSIANAQTSIYLLDSPFTEIMNKDTNGAGLARVTYSGSTPVDVVVKARKSEDTDNPRYFPESQIAEITSSGLLLTISLEVNTFL